MAKVRSKPYRMIAISPALSAKGGYTASFVSDGYSVDAKSVLLPQVLNEGGMKVSPGVAWDIVNGFLMKCASHVATTGETVNAGNLVFTLSIKGWYENRDSRALRENVRVGVRLYDALRPTVTFSMSNVMDQVALQLSTIMSDGCEIGHVRQGQDFCINGKLLVMLDGDTVTATLKTASGEIVTAECPVVESRADHLCATLPAVFSSPSYVGRNVKFTVTGRGGDPAATPQHKEITAVLDVGDVPTPDPQPTPPTGPAPELERGYSEGEGHPDGQVFPNSAFILQGVNLDGAAVKIGYTEEGTYREVVVPDEKLTVTDTVITIASDSIELEDAISSGSATVTFKVTTAGGSATYEAEVQS